MVKVMRPLEASRCASSSVSAQIAHTPTDTRGVAQRSRYSAAISAPEGLMKSANE
jgi:hypothetical protein